MRVGSFLSAVALSIAATSASATVFNFSVVSAVQTGGGSYVPNFQFSIDDATATIFGDVGSTEVDNIFTTGERPSLGVPAGNVSYTVNYTFYVAAGGGGLSDATSGQTYAPHNLYGAQLYSGSNFAPRFTTGVYSLYLRQGYTATTPADAILTITGPAGPVTPGAVPEPAAWTMMLLGLGMVGGSIRCRARGRRLIRA